MKFVVIDEVGSAQQRGHAAVQAPFSQPTIKWLRTQGHDVEIIGRFDAEKCAAADVVWTEWTHRGFLEAAQSGVCKRLVGRVRGFEAWEPDLPRFPWHNVSALVCESAPLKALLCERFANGIPPVRTVVIPAGITLSKFGRVRRRSRSKGLNVAMLGRTDPAKGYQLALQWARTRPGLTLHIGLCQTSANPRLLRYLQTCKPDNVKLYEEVDTPKWLDDIEATYLLSMSYWETLGYGIAEGMAKGLKPLIYAFPGVEQLWPQDCIWRDFTELDAILVAAHNPQRYHDWVATRLNGTTQSAAFFDFVSTLPCLDVTAPPSLTLLLTGDAPLQTRAAAAARHAVQNNPGLVDTIADPEVRTVVLLHMAVEYLQRAYVQQAWQVAVSALAGGPRIDAFCLLGEITAFVDQREQAVGWYRAACALEPSGDTEMAVTQERHERLAELQEEDTT